MKRSWPVHAFVFFCAMASSAQFGLCQLEAVALTATEGAIHTRNLNQEAAASIPNDSNIPAGIRDLMRNAQVHYLEGSNLLKSGECAKAREEFNKAVDLLLSSNWDLPGTPVLNQFFQDLIFRIQQDESRYLQPQEDAEEKPEGAVVDELDQLDLFPISIDAKFKDVVESDLANARFDIPVVLNEKVLQSLDFWLNRGRKFFADGLVRSGRYRDMIQAIFKEASLPLDLMYLAQVESLFKTNALSRAQAKGIWQFGKWTAIRYGLKVNRYIDERSDPEKSTRAAASYLSDLFAMFGDWNLVLAAYNWGEARVQKLVERSGVNDFWNLVDLRRNFPLETKNHVPLIMASIILAKNPTKYGLPKDLDPPLVFDRVPVAKPIDLRAAARVLHTTLDDLKALNPALRGLTTPADYPGFELKVPLGMDADATAKLAQLPTAKLRPPPAEFASRHKVLPGETLGKIAARYKVSVTALEEANNLRAPGALRAGAWLTVPTRRTSSKIKSAASRAPAIKSKTASTRLASSRTKSPMHIASNKKNPPVKNSVAHRKGTSSKVASAKVTPRRNSSAAGRVETLSKVSPAKANGASAKADLAKRAASR